MLVNPIMRVIADNSDNSDNSANLDNSANSSNSANSDNSANLTTRTTPTIFTQSMEGTVWTVLRHRQSKFWAVPACRWTAERSKRPDLHAGPYRVLKKPTP